MAKKPIRYVKVDRGYGPAERWERVKVIDSQTAAGLFDPNEITERLLVEACGGERYWVSYWEEEEVSDERHIR